MADATQFLGLSSDLYQKPANFSGDKDVLAWVVLSEAADAEQVVIFNPADGSFRTVKAKLIIETAQLEGQKPVGLAVVERPRGSILGLKKKVDSAWGEKAAKINEYVLSLPKFTTNASVLVKNLEDLNARINASSKAKTAKVDISKVDALVLKTALEAGDAIKQRKASQAAAITAPAAASVSPAPLKLPLLILEAKSRSLCRNPVTHLAAFEEAMTKCLDTFKEMRAAGTPILPKDVAAFKRITQNVKDHFAKDEEAAAGVAWMSECEKVVDQCIAAK